MRCSKRFQPTRPLRGATVSAGAHLADRLISTHAPLAGRDLRVRRGRFSILQFQPTRPLRGATRLSTSVSLPRAFQPTRPLRGATTAAHVLKPCYMISTHAPLAGRDRSPCGQGRHSRYFNPRAPCGARPKRRICFSVPSHFNPRAPCGARPVHPCDVAKRQHISTHAPLAGRDVPSYSRFSWSLFQPTRPLRGATAFEGRHIQHRQISTHAPLAGRDPALDVGLHSEGISTHAPLAGRDPSSVRSSSRRLLFQPTRPLRGATRYSRPTASLKRFQPTRPLRGATRRRWTAQRSPGHFNPRAPCGARPVSPIRPLRSLLFQPTRPLRGATVWRDGQRDVLQFQPTRPLRGATLRRFRTSFPVEISTHAPLAGRDARTSTRRPRRRNFNPRAPCGARR